MLACAPAPGAEIHVGDGVAREPEGERIIAGAQALLDSAPAIRIRIAPWSKSRSAVLVMEAQQAEIFARDPAIVAVVGHAGSKSTLLAAPVYREAGVPLIVPTATAGKLRSAGPGIFLLAPTDDDIGAFLVDRALTGLGAKRIAVLYIADAYGLGVRHGVLSGLGVRGVPLAGEAAMSGRECGRTRLAARGIVSALLARAHPDAIVVALPQFQARCAIGEIIAAAPGIKVLATDSFVPTAETVPFTPEERDAIQYLVFWEPGTDSLNQAFVRHVREVIGRAPNAGEALTMDAYLLLAAAVRDGHVTRRGITKWLRQLGTPGHPPFQGITGPIDFTAPRRTALHLMSLATGREIP